MVHNLSVAQSVKRIVSGRGSFFTDRFGVAECAPEQASAASFLSQVDAELANVPPCCGQCSAQPTWDSFQFDNALRGPSRKDRGVGQKSSLSDRINKLPK